MKLLRVGIKNYRSLGEEHVFLDFRKKINLLIGANNCGKSNVLRALELLSQKARPFKALPETDRFQRKPNVNVGFHFVLETEATDHEELKILPTFSIEWTREEGMDGKVSHSDIADRLDFNRFNNLMSAVVSRHFVAMPNAAQLQMEGMNVALGLLRNQR